MLSWHETSFLYNTKTITSDTYDVMMTSSNGCHDDVIKWKHFPRYWPFVRGIHRGPHKGQWRGDLMFSLICVVISGWVNNREAGDLRRYRAHYDVTLIYHNIHIQPLIVCLCWFVFNPLRAKFFRGNKNIYLHFKSFLHIDMTGVVEILPQVGQERTYST